MVWNNIIQGNISQHRTEKILTMLLTKSLNSCHHKNVYLLDLILAKVNILAYIRCMCVYMYTHIYSNI